jgi:hypothetical protein
MSDATASESLSLSLKMAQWMLDNRKPATVEGREGFRVNTPEMFQELDLTYNEETHAALEEAVNVVVHLLNGCEAALN